MLTRCTGVLLCRYGAALGPDAFQDYKSIMVETAHSLAVRYSPVVKMTRSWGSVGDSKQFEVIIDNLMNLELLFWAAKETGNQTLYAVAQHPAGRPACLAQGGRKRATQPGNRPRNYPCRRQWCVRLG